MDTPYLSFLFYFDQTYLKISIPFFCYRMVCSNCLPCAPEQYQKYGEPVVQACVEHGANHVDISGEPQVGLKVNT